MKVELIDEKEKVFEPFTLKIDVENKEDALYLFVLFNAAVGR